MTRVRAIKEAVENFVTSTPIASIKYQRYLVSKGVREPEKGSINYALGIILNSGLPQEKSKELLHDVRDRTKLLLRELGDYYEKTFEWFRLDNAETAIKEVQSEVDKGYEVLIENFRLINGILLSGPDGKLNKALFNRKSAYLLYHWESWQAARCSLLDALCGYYAIAFALLRLSLEQQLRAAFYQSLCERNYRETLSRYAYHDNKKVSIKEYLINKISPFELEKMEINSAYLFDIIEYKMKEFPQLLNVRGILIPQLSHWKIIDSEKKVGKLYRKLSADVHGTPWRTDVGRSLHEHESKLFKTPTFMRKDFIEYVETLLRTIDFCCSITLSMNQDLIRTTPRIKSFMINEMKDKKLRELRMRLTIAKLYEILHN